jgi:hypothetical protein
MNVPNKNSTEAKSPGGLCRLFLRASAHGPLQEDAGYIKSFKVDSVEGTFSLFRVMSRERCRRTLLLSWCSADQFRQD